MLIKLCDYNNWANTLLINALTEAKQTTGLLPDYCIKLLSHIGNAQKIWAGRIQGTVADVGVWQLHDLETCGKLIIETGTELKKIVQDNPALAHVISYKISTGALFETSLEDILLHVFNHGTYHRAQIAKNMRENGMQPINTDYIQFVRSV